MLRYRVWRVSGNSQHVYLAVSVFHIHVIKARASESHDLYSELCESVYNRGVDRIVDEYANTVKACRKLYRILVELRFIIFKRYAALAAEFFKGRLVVWLRIKECNFHFFRFSPCFSENIIV